MSHDAPPYKLYVYRCANDGTLLIAPVRAPRGEAYKCRLCHSYMKFVWEDESEVKITEMEWRP